MAALPLAGRGHSGRASYIGDHGDGGLLFSIVAKVIFE